MNYLACVGTCVGIVGLMVYVPIRLGALGVEEIRIPKEDQNNCNSYGMNWFTVKSYLLLFNEVVEMEEWIGRDKRVMSYGKSLKPIKIVYD